MYNPSNELMGETMQKQATSSSKVQYFKDIATHCSQYKQPVFSKSLIQLTLTLSLFLASCSGLYLSVQYSFFLGYALLLLPTAGLLVKLFIIQHDCGHGSFFKSTKANNYLGRTMSLFTWTPYYYWKRMHNIHHAGSGNLERRGYGAIETLTIQEYKALPKGEKFKYRLYRNPYLLLLIGTPLFMIIAQRFSMCQPFILPDGSKRLTFSGNSIMKSVMGTNLSLLVVYGALGYFLGYSTLLHTYLPVLVATCWIGGWLFYVQHQFEETHWDRQHTWSYNEAAIMGSSYYDLPKWLQWFTGNIGIHHVHHLNASIPNYRLQECIDDLPDLKTINRMTLKDSFQCLQWALWDEDNRKMVPFSALKSAHNI